MLRNSICRLLLAMLVAIAAPHAQAPQYPDPTERVLTHREQAPLVKAWIQKRFDTLMPQLMDRTGIDMWVIASREYNDDPTFRSMAPLTTFSSRRRTILVFYNPGGGKPVERLSIGRFDYDGLFTVVPTHNDAQYEGLRKVVEERNPKVIGINESDSWNHADGLTANEKRRLMAVLGPKYSPRVKSAELLAVGWLETKLPEELDAYRHVMKVAHLVIREAFSNKVVTPGKTTSEDVVWWMRQRVAELGLGSWFHPSVTIHRQGGVKPGDNVIQPGDMLHTDFGVVYLGLSTDTQHNAYVLKGGETDAPQGLKDGLKAANRLQDITMQFATVGSSGNEALRSARQLAIKEGLVPSIYCHPVGYHGHAAGPPIGMTDYQEGVPVRGDYVFQPYTWHSIELNVTHKVAEWGDQAVRFALEEDAAILAGGKWDWIDGRQTEFYLIK
ncbi:MAG: M24 family metallopeptidase [Acidobacteria bacterium]|nr:M24 family metallopeptidase [Acidobacteriota bacterium]